MVNSRLPVGQRGKTGVRMSIVNQSPAAWQHCWVEVDAGALRHNAGVARSCAGAGDLLMGIVKANGYGHGLATVAEVLDSEVDWFGVASAAEGIVLREEVGSEKPIFILGATLPAERKIVVERGFVPTISSALEGDAYDRLALEHGRSQSVHLCVDTGMGRVGFLPDDPAVLARMVKGWKNLNFEGLMSHMPSADEDEVFTRSQVERFEGVVEELRVAGLVFKYVHLANSAGLMDYTSRSCTLKRAGLMLYGVSPLAEWQDRLKQTLKWKTRVTLVRDLPPGCGISYGRTFITEREPFTRVATIAAGYGDGYPRSLSGKGAEVLIHGVRCPILGRVTMDQMMVDVTELRKSVEPGDEVSLLGGEVTAVELAEKAGTIPWEIFTGISQRVARILV
jgi:alanine racemase